MVRMDWRLRDLVGLDPGTLAIALNVTLTIAKRASAILAKGWGKLK
jgi:hypothetical protein